MNILRCMNIYIDDERVSNDNRRYRCSLYRWEGWIDMMRRRDGYKEKMIDIWMNIRRWRRKVVTGGLSNKCPSNPKQRDAFPNIKIHQHYLYHHHHICMITIIIIISIYPILLVDMKVKMSPGILTRSAYNNDGLWWLK